MTPRSLRKGTGLRGPGQDIFPESAKEEARLIGLVDDAVLVFKREETEDSGGDWSSDYVPAEERIRGRIDSLGDQGSTGEFAASIDESTTHIVTVDPDADVDHKDRLEVEGQMWTITAERFFTDESTKRLQVKELTTE
jgi:hypothetical protein